MPLDFSQFADSVVLTIQKALIPIFERLSASEQFQKDVKADIGTLTDIRDRLLMIETKAAALQMPTPVDLAPVLVRQAELGVVLDALKAWRDGAEVADSRAREEFAGLRERLAVLESRPLVAGPPGPAGKDGDAGKDGTPGLTYEGVYQDGQQYEKGQLVTWAGSMWHANESTKMKPGDGSKDWTMTVKRGRDGKDVSEPRMGPLPVVHR